MRIGKFSLRQRWIDREVSPSLTFAVASLISISGFILGLLTAWYGPWLWDEVLLLLQVHKLREEEAFHRLLSSSLAWKDVFAGVVARFAVVPVGVVGSIFSYHFELGTTTAATAGGSGLLFWEDSYKTSGGVGVGAIVNVISHTANFTSLGA
ncbi:hypothetical protein V8F20_000367 [Naviculisporaceae sp. PSN 640]